MEKKVSLKSSNHTKKLVQVAILTAIVILMSFTPVGYLNIWSISITFISIPVAIGAVVIGPAAGAFLGLVFGVTSLIKALTGDPFGTLLLQLNPLLTVILCIVPRTLMGFLAGYTFKLLKKVIKTRRYFAYGITSLSAALYNTVLFVSGLGLLFKPYAADVYGDSFWIFIKTFILANAIIEGIVAAILGALICQAIVTMLKKQQFFV